MGMFKSIQKRWDWLTKVRFDKRTGFYVYTRFGKQVYIRYPRHFLAEKWNVWNCENLVYKHYLPGAGDVVVDLGAGYGEEALYLAQRSRGFRYIGVEAQPVIYECLANTFNDAGEEFVAVPYVITDSDMVRFFSQRSYAAVGTVPRAYIEVPTISWEDFLKRYAITQIDLFKMNIEGAEKEVLQGISDFSIIRRFIISCHDFRANKNEGEWYRSKEIVTGILIREGYKIKTFDYGINWADDWIYAERQDLD